MNLFNLFIKSVFVDNMIFAYFLGMCSYLAVSKTVNLPAGATTDDVAKVYMQSWKMGQSYHWRQDGQTGSTSRNAPASFSSCPSLI